MDEIVKIVSDNSICYTKHGYIIHREDGPAVEYFNGDESWMINNVYHRLGGPAIIRTGEYGWYIDGENMSFNEYLSHMDSNVAVELILKYSSEID